MSKNKYLTNAIPALYRAQLIDVMAFTFIDTYRFTIPSVSIEEAVSAFIRRYKIDESLTESAVKQSYYRTLQLVTDAERTS